MMLVSLALSLMLASAPARSAQGVRSVDPRQVAGDVDAILKEVSTLRQLAVKEKVAVEVSSKERIRGYVKKRLAEAGEVERLALQGRLWARQGLVPGDMDFPKYVEDLLISQIGGYYDPERDTFIVADWIPDAMQKPVMAHELTHALQDQHFDLSSFLEPIHGNQDRELARSALVEGDGLAVMLDYSLKPAGQDFTTVGDLVALTQMSLAMGGDVGVGDMALPPDVPDVLKELLLFPYVYGATFLQQVRTEHPWSAVDKAYADLPASTEQILRPEKYWKRRDAPRAVDVAPVAARLGLGKPVFVDVQGQFLAFVWLKQSIPQAEAVAASDGWGGDQIAIYGEAGRETVAFLSVWDTEGDAREFAAALAKSLGALTDKMSDKDGKAEAASRTVMTARGAASIDVVRDTVTFVLAPPK